MHVETFHVERLGVVDEHVEISGLLRADDQLVGPRERLLPFRDPCPRTIERPVACDLRVWQAFFRPDAQQRFIVVCVAAGHEKRPPSRWIVGGAAPDGGPRCRDRWPRRGPSAARDGHVIERYDLRGDSVEVGLETQDRLVTRQDVVEFLDPEGDVRKSGVDGEGDARSVRARRGDQDVTCGVASALQRRERQSPLGRSRAIGQNESRAGVCLPDQVRPVAAGERKRPAVGGEGHGDIPAGDGLAAGSARAGRLGDDRG